MIVLYHRTMYRPSFKQELDNVSFTQAVALIAQVAKLSLG